ncbi:hypothetical protein CA13_57730 [Planctomycetes bacterium CA13]|uniref:Uncharacterized protein n=1 Tax=Novipirellula herctigrandis TaxID=2527986 RepID=A0A5C5ZAX9_9BACT|nr:hypothetical protein CA13_57730 [Planctomycetes bacterium CA13]
MRRCSCPPPSQNDSRWARRGGKPEAILMARISSAGVFRDGWPAAVPTNQVRTVLERESCAIGELFVANWQLLTRIMSPSERLCLTLMCKTEIGIVA